MTTTDTTENFLLAKQGFDENEKKLLNLRTWDYAYAPYFGGIPNSDINTLEQQQLSAQLPSTLLPGLALPHTEPYLLQLNGAITTRFTIGTALISMNHLEQRIVSKTLISNYTPHNIDMLLIAFMFFSIYVALVLAPVKEKLDKSMATAELINDVYRIK
jgi:hypothetical protein